MTFMERAFLAKFSIPIVAFVIILSIPTLLFATNDSVSSPVDLWNIFAFLLGAFLGLAELLSRYRDEPWKASFSPWGFFYMVINGLVSVGAYWVVIHYPVFQAISKPGFPSAMAAGLGSMAIFRSKVFIYKSENGNEYPIGPDIIVNIFMKTIDRQIDRRQARRRQALITDQMAAITDFNKAEEYLSISLLSFQSLSSEEREKIKGEIEKLKASNLPNEVKILALGYTLLDFTGESNFKQCVKELKKYLGSKI